MARYWIIAFSMILVLLLGCESNMTPSASPLTNQSVSNNPHDAAAVQTRASEAPVTSSEPSEKTINDIRSIFDSAKSRADKEYATLSTKKEEIDAAWASRDVAHASGLMEDALKYWLEVRPLWVDTALLAYENKGKIGRGYELLGEAVEANADEFDRYFFDELRIKAKVAVADRKPDSDKLQTFISLIERHKKSPAIQELNSIRAQEGLETWAKAMDTYQRLELFLFMSPECQILYKQCIQINDCADFEEAQSVGLC